MHVSRAGQKFSDKELVAGCLKNDRTMQRALFDQFKVQLYSLAYRLLNNHEAANDAVQEAFIDIFGSLGTFRYQSSLYSWMRTIVVRKSLAGTRKQGWVHTEDQAVPEIPVSDNYNFTAEHLEQAILSLPEQARAVFILIEVEGYKHREVADILDIHAGTSKSQLNYAKRILRQRLTPGRNEEKV